MELTEDQYAHVYGAVCDAIYRAQHDGITDGYHHTNSMARRLALEAMNRADITWIK